MIDLYSKGLKQIVFDFTCEIRAECTIHISYSSMCDAFCGALQRRGIAPPSLLWPPTKTSAKFKFVFHRLDHVHDPIHSMLPPKKVLRCCNAHPAANNQKRNAFFISGFRVTLTQIVKFSLNYKLSRR